MNKVRTAIIPVAGLGTRMLPASKSVPKELLPVYDTPLLQFTLDECCDAGVERIVIVSHRSKTAIEHFLARDEGLEDNLRAKGKTRELSRLQCSGTPEGVEVVITYQDEQKGLGHAVLCARPHVLPGPVAVVLPDDLVLGASELSNLAGAFDPARMNSLVGAMEVSREEVSNYGVFDIEGSGQGVRPARGFVEKPDADAAPSNLAAIGRYILGEAIFDELERTEAGSGGEVQLTDAIAALGKVHACPIEGRRFDCGRPQGLFDATLHYRTSGSETLQLAAE